MEMSAAPEESTAVESDRLRGSKSECVMAGCADSTESSAPGAGAGAWRARAACAPYSSPNFHACVCVRAS